MSLFEITRPNEKQAWKSLVVNTISTKTLEVDENASIGGDLDITGNLTVDGTINGGTSSASLIPDTDNVYNIGSLTNRWANLYLGTDANISGNVNAGDITAGGDINATNANISGNVNANILQASSVSNQVILGNTNTAILNAVAPSASRIYSIQDPLNDAEFVMNQGNQTINGSKVFSENVSINTANNNATLNLQTNGGSQATLSITDGVGTVLSDVLGGGSISIVGNNVETPNVTLDDGSGVISAVSANFSATTNQLVLGTTNTVTIDAAAPASNVIVRFEDVLNPINNVLYTNGTQSITGTKFFFSRPRMVASGNLLEFGQGGAGNTMNITMSSPAANRVYTMPDAGADAQFVMSSRGTVTQLTSLVTPVTLDQLSGVITTVSATTAAASTEQFVVNNSLVSASSVVLANVCSYSGTYATNGFPVCTVQNVTGGSFTIAISNVHVVNALSGILKIAFVVC